MKTILIDAKKLMEQPEPIKALAGYFGLHISDPDELRLRLQSQKENLICAVINWQNLSSDWEPVGDLLEGIQQHSSTFYLIWGVEDDFVNTKAEISKDLLINPPADF